MNDSWRFPGEEILYHSYQDWILLILVLGLLFLIYSYYLKPLYFTRLFNSVFNQTATSKLIAEQNSLTTRISGSLNIVFYVNSALILFLIIQRFDFNVYFDNEPMQLLVLFIGIPLFFNLRIILYHFVGWVTKHVDLQFQYLSYWMILNKFFGLLLIPFLFLILYLPHEYQIWAIYGGLGVYSLLFLAKLFRGLQISIKNNISLFSIILYLCALEILPVGMLIKYLAS
ncbi:MAG: DUF4271 domain-containing protein [Bacteroidales bacterium]|jgi:hypothetical protein|nr:DUF4271 domain-containing protein [Bacteroidales bacterium]